MSRILAPVLRHPLAFVGGAFVLLWVVYVGVSLRPRLGLPSLDTSRTVLISRGNQITLVTTAPDGQAHTVKKTIGPVVPWKKGLVYWDNQKRCLIILSPGQKPRAVWPHPSRKMRVASLMPAPDGVYLNVDDQTGWSVLDVHLPGGAARVMHNVDDMKSSETTRVYASETMTNTTAIVVIVHYAHQKTRTVSVGMNGLVPSWDYDPVCDAVVWIEDETLCYSRPAQSWRKKVANARSVAVIPQTGDVWVQTRGGWGSRGVLVFSGGGIERGWRWKGDTLFADALWELTPEQEKMARALPDHR